MAEIFRQYDLKDKFVKFIYSEKATKFCEISTIDLSYVITVKSTVEISQNFVPFSEYMNFNISTPNFQLYIRGFTKFGIKVSRRLQFLEYLRTLHFKFQKVLKYSRNCSLLDTLIPWSLKITWIPYCTYLIWVDICKKLMRTFWFFTCFLSARIQAWSVIILVIYKFLLILGLKAEIFRQYDLKDKFSVVHTSFE